MFKTYQNIACLSMAFLFVTAWSLHPAIATPEAQDYAMTQAMSSPQSSLLTESQASSVTPSLEDFLPKEEVSGTSSQNLYIQGLLQRIKDLEEKLIVAESERFFKVSAYAPETILSLKDREVIALESQMQQFASYILQKLKKEEENKAIRQNTLDDLNQSVQEVHGRVSPAKLSNATSLMTVQRSSSRLMNLQGAQEEESLALLAANLWIKNHQKNLAFYSHADFIQKIMQVFETRIDETYLPILKNFETQYFSSLASSAPSRKVSLAQLVFKRRPVPQIPDGFTLELQMPENIYTSMLASPQANMFSINKILVENAQKAIEEAVIAIFGGNLLEANNEMGAWLHMLQQKRQNADQKIRDAESRFRQQFKASLIQGAMLPTQIKLLKDLRQKIESATLKKEILIRVHSLFINELNELKL